MFAEDNNVLIFYLDFWTTVKRLTTNATYMSVILGYSGLMFGVGSTTAFMPKFLEVAFSKSSQSANLTFGKKQLFYYIFG